MLRLFSQYVPAGIVLLVVVDAAAAAASLIVSLHLAYGSTPESWQEYARSPEVYWRAAALCGCFLICAYYNGAYLIQPRELPPAVRASRSIARRDGTDSRPALPHLAEPVDRASGVLIDDGAHPPLRDYLASHCRDVVEVDEPPSQRSDRRRRRYGLSRRS